MSLCLLDKALTTNNTCILLQPLTPPSSQYEIPSYRPAYVVKDIYQICINIVCVQHTRYLKIEPPSRESDGSSNCL